MAKLTRKCQRCKIDDTHKDSMKVEYVGSKNTPKYYHENCYNEHLKEKQFKEEESRKLDELVKVIQDIYGIKELPTQVYPFIQKLRNGESVFNKQQTGKRYKQGYDFEIIKETYNYCSDTIEYWNQQKDFNGSFMNAFRYGLSIVIDKIYFVEQRMENRKQQVKAIERQMKHMSESEEDVEFVSSYKKKNDNSTFDFLND